MAKNIITNVVIPAALFLALAGAWHEWTHTSPLYVTPEQAEAWEAQHTVPATYIHNGF